MQEDNFGSDVARPSDFVDNPRLPGCGMARHGLVLATIGSTSLLVGWLTIGLLTPGGLAEIDHAALAALHETYDPNNPIGPDWLESAVRDVTALGSNTVVVLLTAAAVALLAMTRRIGPAVLIAISVTVAFALNTVMKLAFDRTRPDFISDIVSVETASFPSSHAMLASVLYLLLAATAAREIADRRIANALMGMGIATAVTVGLTRLYLGVHWPSDVMVGWLLGAAIALAAWQLARTPTPPCEDD